MDARIEAHDHEADHYDGDVLEYEYFGNEALFGLCYEYLTAGESLLDLGIGTGLSSRLFAQYGMKVTGLDGSPKMLEICRGKGIAEALVQHDLNTLPLPFADGQFNHLLAGGLFHFFPDLAPLFQEAHRLLTPEGIFAFNVMTPEQDLPRVDLERGDPTETPTPWGVSVWHHSYGYVTRLLEAAGFELLKRQRLVMLGGSGGDNAPDMVYALYVTKRL